MKKKYLTIKKNSYSTYLLIFMTLFSLHCCGEKNNNMITYYNKVNEIDSIYRIAGNHDLAAKQYRELFMVYSPKNQDYIEEYGTYLMLADKHQLNFGGKESLYKLINLITSSGNEYKKYMPLFKKYGIDSTEIIQAKANWKKGLNKTLIDSLTVASSRDKESGRSDTAIMRKNDNKNLNLFLQIFNTYGYPSEQKVGTTGNDGEPLTTITILSHLICLNYNKIAPKLSKYLKNGDFSPKLFALTIDKYYMCKYNKSFYNFYSETASHEDSLIINRRRKTIGLPSLKHSAIIIRDYNNK